MARFTTLQCFIAIGFFFVQHLIYSVECDDKRIIIYVPRRIKTVHHHHHHVVLMDPKNKKVMHTKPYSDRSSMAEGYQQILQSRDHQQLHHHQQQQQQQYIQHHHQYQQEPQYLQSAPVAGHPSSYQEQRKTVGGNVMLYPAAQLPVVHVPVAYTTWPASRKKRSKMVARLYTH